MEDKSRLVIFLSLAAGILVGLVFGGYGGFRYGASLILNGQMDLDARKAQFAVVTLRRLRTGEIPQAIESIEARLDDQLILFDPLEPYPNINEATQLEIDNAIQDSMQYRSEYPRTSDRPYVDTMINNLFDKN